MKLVVLKVLQKNINQTSIPRNYFVKANEIYDNLKNFA